MIHQLKSFVRRKNLSYHYDISDRFYELILGETMAYSSGLLKNVGDSLEQLQLNNYKNICEKLSLSAQDTFLDLGCGWGGLLLYVAKQFQIPVVGVTLNQSHHDYVIAKARKLGVSDLVSVRKIDLLQDSLEGQFTKISSVEMYEHVRIKNLPKYFQMVHSLLRPQGHLFIQTIVSGSAKRSRLGGHKFMDRYIFPGGEVPTYPALKEIFEGVDWSIKSVEDISDSYVSTLGYWLKNLQNNSRDCIAEVGERIYRLWILYLAGSLIAFEERTMQDYQTVIVKK